MCALAKYVSTVFRYNSGSTVLSINTVDITTVDPTNLEGHAGFAFPVMVGVTAMLDRTRYIQKRKNIH